MSRNGDEDSLLASQEVSKRMLEGWKLLADTCPNPTCNHCALLSNREVSFSWILRHAL